MGRLEAAYLLERHRERSDKQFSYEWCKANRQPYAGGLLRCHRLDKSNMIAQRLRGRHLLAGPNGVVRPRDQDGAGGEGRKRRHPPSLPPPPPDGAQIGGRLHTPEGGRVDTPSRRRNHIGVAAFTFPNIRWTRGTAGTTTGGTPTVVSPMWGTPDRHSPQWLPRRTRGGLSARSTNPSWFTQSARPTLVPSPTP